MGYQYQVVRWFFGKDNDNRILTLPAGQRIFAVIDKLYESGGITLVLLIECV